MRRHQQQITERRDDDRRPLDEREARQRLGYATVWGSDSFEPEPHFAKGTRELDRVSLEAGASTDEHTLSHTAVIRPVCEVTPNGLREEDVAQIVHDLKNPLATIALEAWLLDDKLADGARSDLRGAVARITHNILFLDRMVEDLLDSCSLASGHFDLHLGAVELRELLEQVIDRAVATRDRDRVFLEAPCAMTVTVDALRIERVVANLLANALKYAPKRSGIVVRLETDAHLVRVSVIDAGSELTPAEMTYIFDKYRRTTTAHAHEGCGLGLYVSRKIVEAHGGRIDVECSRGAGTRFFFELPVRE